MSGQISFGTQPQFFISIDWVLSNTLATDQDQVNRMATNVIRLQKHLFRLKKM